MPEPGSQETDIPCPICGERLTNVDGAGTLECQAYERGRGLSAGTDTPHFWYFKGDDGNYFNFERYFDMVEGRKKMSHLANAAKLINRPTL